MHKPLICCLALLLAGCATPQQRAINNYCSLEAYQRHPQQFESQRVLRSFHIGDKIVGTRSRCTTTNSRPDRKHPDTHVTETTCRNEDITEPIYESRYVYENIDINTAVRDGYFRTCQYEAMQKGMFADAK